MRLKRYQVTLRTALLGICVLLLAVGTSFSQQQVNLSAGPSAALLPDGSAIPMWGYTCGGAVSGSSATCSALNGAALGWSPVVITVPTGQDLQINLTNNLIFAAGSGANKIPTSIVIAGQLGGGLGDPGQRTTTPSPAHGTQQTTWPIANTGATNTPPPQGPRVQSFSTEVAPGATASLIWRAPRAGTYLIESGTHPSIQAPMGLYGILVVTNAPSSSAAGTAYAGVNYDADVPMLLSEIDPVQNTAVQNAVGTVGFSEMTVWSGQPGGCGNPASATYGTCYPPAVNYSPLYYLINGVAFDKTNAAASQFSAAIPNPPLTGTPTGQVLVRFVNAGLRMHVPSIVGALTGGATPIPGFALIAEDGNPLPGTPRVQSEVFLAAGKTYDVLVNGPAAGATALPVFDRELSLSANATAHDAGMLAYISVNGAALPSAPELAAAVARPDAYSVVPGKTLVISDPSVGVIANDTNVAGVQLATAPAKGTVTLNADGTFTYVPNSGWTAPDTFVYKANGNAAITATVTLSTAAIEAGSGITMTDTSYTSNVATTLSIKPPGILSVDHDAAGYPLTVSATSVSALTATGGGGGTGTIAVDANGGFNATVTAPGTYTFTYKAKNSQGTESAASATVTLVFPQPTHLQVQVVDGVSKAAVADYRWIIEEDRTFYVDPTKTTNSGTSIVPTFGTNFHTSYMPMIATGCTGPLSCESGQTLLGAPTVCDVGNGVCRTGAGTGQQAATDPGQVHLDPAKRYYISILPGDAANPFNTANKVGGHTMGGAPISANQTSVMVLVEPTPLQPAKLSVFVFEDDFPLNGENDAGGGVDVLAPNEPGLGGFNIELFDDAGGTGDATGQMTYDMFNMPLSNSLAGTPDPANHGIDACPISQQATNDPTQKGIVGQIVTCPKYEADGKTPSPLAGQAVVANLMPGRYGVVAYPSADRIAKGEEWLQTNTLDGQKAHDSFLRIGEPSYFQEFGPAGYHVSIGFANPAIINSRLAGVCNGTDPNVTGTNCTNSVTAVVTTERMSRTPDERLYSSGSNDSFAFTQCYVSIGDPDGEDFAFTKCDANGKFTLSGLPDGNWRITVFDQWNDMLVDGLSTPVLLAGGKALDLGQIAMNQWQANIYTRSFVDQHGDGVYHGDDPGLALVKTNVRFRDGSFSNRNNTDLNGVAAFNEVFPLFSWYIVETDNTRFKNTGTHVVYDTGGPADGTVGGGNSTIGKFMANTQEAVPLPANLRVPGAVYCANADCNGFSIANGPATSASGSTGRIDPPWVTSEGWQGFSGQNSFLEFGKKPFITGENGGIHGHVIYASTRPFDDPQFGVQNSWEPLVPGVTINLYQEGKGADGTQTLTLVDTTKTSSWDDWAQGFRSDGVPNMNCPGQTTTDPFYFSLYNQPMYLDLYNNGGTSAHTIPYNSQFKCYDGMHNWNQLQPAPYDGMYQFPSIVGRDPSTGAPAGTGSTNGVAGALPGTNCTICAKNPTDGTPMLPAGKYVVEIVVPPGYELVKEEDKNILIGDNFIAPVTQQFAGLGNVFILPDQAQIASAYNPNNAQNPTNSLGRIQNLPSHEGDTPTVDSFWPCVGESRVVPDFISLYPQSGEVAPFAGATRNLCDRKEVTLDDQTSLQAEFFIFSETHAAAHFTGVITDDFTSEFDPFSPQFGEKFSPPDLPVSIKDFNGNEISRVYADHWGSYDGLNYSTWEVNPPNPTGYSPTMMITCMNDPGPIPGPNGTMITDPLYNPAYSQFCYEIPFMPGQTQYMDTPVVPTAAFAGAGYNNPDCAYPNATPAISSVTSSDAPGPWVSAAGHSLTITALGDQTVNNYGYSGPSATTSPFNQKTVNRHYGFGSTAGTVTIGGVSAKVTAWSDSSITVTVPPAGGLNGVPLCGIQQQAQYGGSTAYCGQLVITAANGKQSIDTVTVTIGGKTPTIVTGSIQSAIDNAQPGDLLIVPPGVYNEMVLMWKPVRLQGVGAASSVINANTHPAGKLDPWRRQVACLFGLAMNGTPISATNKFDPSGTFTCSPQMQFSVDRLPLEATVGWDASLNGNLAELLQEPTLLGAYEGAGITVLGKGVDFHGGDPFAADTFPAGTTLLTANNCTASPTNPTNPFPGNFQCNPSRIDGLGITNSSQGGGGIFAHAWNHNLEVSNNRIHSNTGTLAGGLSIGQGEFPPSYSVGGTNEVPGSCQTGTYPNEQLPYCFNLNVNVHNNNITNNSSIGDELFSATPSGPGGVAFCNGSDYYKFNYNWVCGNMSTGDGGGIAHLGFSYNGDIEHNSILFNQSLNPTIPTNGGGILVHGTPDVDPTCGVTTDQDCAAPGMSDGTGPGLVINANLIQGNAAESGSGGGIRLQGINGTDVATFPRQPQRWYSVDITNNIISNNVAGWDGAGVSLQDALFVNFVNNTVASNDTTASAGVLFNTLGAPMGAYPGPSIPGQITSTGSAPQPAGMVTIQNSPPLTAALAALPAGTTVNCPPGHYAGASGTNGTCTKISYPLLANNVFWQNRTFYIGVGGVGMGAQNQQNIVTLYNAFTTTQAPNQPQADATSPNGSGTIVTGGTGACVPGTSFWDLGVRGDTGPANHNSGFTLNPTYSILTNTTGYSATAQHNTASNPTVLSQYCNGSRVPPELGSSGYQVPPGISDATVPNPIFSLLPAATVDEGNNWINMTWGPLSLSNPVNGANLGNYGIAAGSPAINYIPISAGQNYFEAPALDFYGNPRKTNLAVDAGAVEFAAAPVAIASITGGPLAFGNVAVNSTSAIRTLTLHNTGNAPLDGINLAITGPFTQAGGTCGLSLAGGSSCTIGVVFQPTAEAVVSGSLAVTASVPVTGSPVALSGRGILQGVLTYALTGTVPQGVTLGSFTIPVFNITLPTLQFGNQTTRQVAHVSVTNTGTLPVIFNSVTFSNMLGTNFTQTNNCPIGGPGLAIGASCTLNVTFNPPPQRASIMRAAEYRFTDDAAGSPQFLGVTGNHP